MKLEGSLDVFPLRELIEMTVYSSVTGAINIYNEQHRAQIFFHDGQVYHAIYDDQKQGTEALSEIFGETTASFAFVADITAEAETLSGDVFDLIDTAERMATRWKRVHRLVPDMHTIPVLLCPGDRARYSISPEHWTIFTTIDGQRSINDIVTKLNIDPIEVCEAIAQMCEDHLLELHKVTYVQPILTSAPADEQPASPRMQPTSGILGRLMANVPVKAERQPAPSTRVKDIPRDTSPSSEPVYPSEVDKILQLLRT